MSVLQKIDKRFINFGTGTTQVNDTSLPVTYSFLNYVATGTSLFEHLQGVDFELLLRQQTVAGVDTITGTSYTIQDSDAGKYKRFTNSSDITITVPSGLTVDVGTAMTFRQAGLGGLTVSGSTQTFNGSLSIATQHTEMQIVYIGSDIWDVLI